MLIMIECLTNKRAIGVLLSLWIQPTLMYESILKRAHQAHGIADGISLFGMGDDDVATNYPECPTPPRPESLRENRTRKPQMTPEMH